MVTRDVTLSMCLMWLMLNVLVSFMEPDNWGEVYNIGFGKNWSIQEIADAISSNQVHLSGRPGEMRETLASIFVSKM